MSAKVILENVNKTFKGIKVIDNVNVEFESGKIHGIIGRNGSGKTVLFKIICGLIKADTGNIIISDKRVGVDVDFPDNIGAIIETPGFLAFQSGYKNLEYLASIKNKIKKEDIFKAMQTVGLDPKSKKHVGKYSLGMRQRLGLAQAIMEDPELLILDEPMNGLDKDGVSDMREYLINLKEHGKTILIASHSTEDIETLCDTVCEMNKGVLNKLKSWN